MVRSSFTVALCLLLFSACASQRPQNARSVYDPAQPAPTLRIARVASTESVRALVQRLCPDECRGFTIRDSWVELVWEPGVFAFDVSLCGAQDPDTFVRPLVCRAYLEVSIGKDGELIPRAFAYAWQDVREREGRSGSFDALRALAPETPRARAIMKLHEDAWEGFVWLGRRRDGSYRAVYDDTLAIVWPDGRLRQIEGLRRALHEAKLCDEDVSDESWYFERYLTAFDLLDDTLVVVIDHTFQAEAIVPAFATFFEDAAGSDARLALSDGIACAMKSADGDKLDYGQLVIEHGSDYLRTAYSLRHEGWRTPLIQGTMAIAVVCKLDDDSIDGVHAFRCFESRLGVPSLMHHYPKGDVCVIDARNALIVTTEQTIRWIDLESPEPAQALLVSSLEVALILDIGDRNHSDTWLPTDLPDDGVNLDDLSAEQVNDELIEPIGNYLENRGQIVYTSDRVWLCGMLPLVQYAPLNESESLRTWIMAERRRDTPRPAGMGHWNPGVPRLRALLPVTCAGERELLALAFERQDDSIARPMLLSTDASATRSLSVDARDAELWETLLYHFTELPNPALSAGGEPLDGSGMVFCYSDIIYRLWLEEYPALTTPHPDHSNTRTSAPPAALPERRTTQHPSPRSDVECLGSCRNRRTRGEEHHDPGSDR